MSGELRSCDALGGGGLAGDEENAAGGQSILQLYREFETVDTCRTTSLMSMLGECAAASSKACSPLFATATE